MTKEEAEAYSQKNLYEIKGVTKIEEESITDEDFVDDEIVDENARKTREMDYSVSEGEFYDEDNYMQID